MGVPAGSESEQRPILITGATGFVGMEVMARFLPRSRRHIYVLIRARNDAGARRAGELLRAPSDNAAGGRAAKRISGADASSYWVGCRDPEAVLGGVSRAAEASALRVVGSPRSMMTFSALVSAARPNVS